MIQNIEEVRADLQIDPFGDREVFHSGQIPLEESRTAKVIAPNLSDYITPYSVVPRLYLERISVVALSRPLDISGSHSLAGEIGPHRVTKESAD